MGRAAEGQPCWDLCFCRWLLLLALLPLPAVLWLEVCSSQRLWVAQ